MFYESRFMAVVARILGVSALAAVLGIGVGFVVVRASGDRGDPVPLYFVLGCVGSMIGAVAGAAGEIVAAVSRKPLHESREG